MAAAFNHTDRPSRPAEVEALTRALLPLIDFHTHVQQLSPDAVRVAVADALAIVQQK